MYLNTGVKNSREHPMMIPVMSPDRPVLASLSLFTADLEKDPNFAFRTSTDSSNFGYQLKKSCVQ